MAMDDHTYCADHGLPLTDQNLAYVDRVRDAGAWLRGRAMKGYRDACLAAGVGFFMLDEPASLAYITACKAAERFEAEAMANRRLHRDRQSRRAQAQRVRLIHAAPLRVPVAQHDVDGLALFGSARSPSLFAGA